MAQAEVRASAGKGLHATNAALPTDTALEEMQPKSGVQQHWWNAALPVLSGDPHRPRDPIHDGTSGSGIRG